MPTGNLFGPNVKHNMMLTCEDVGVPTNKMGSVSERCTWLETLHVLVMDFIKRTKIRASEKPTENISAFNALI